MKYFFIIILYIASSFLYLSCSDEKIIKDEEKFAAIYVNLLINEETNRRDSLKLKSEEEKIFKKNKATRAQFEETLKYYNEKPERWREVFELIDEYYDKIQMETKSR
jgi:predicted ribosome quality control (RQC) complex YloA/Tae2 family protein